MENKTAEEILESAMESAQIQGIDFSVIIFNDALAAMKQIAELAFDAGVKYERRNSVPFGGLYPKNVPSKEQFIKELFNTK
jgi:hypothetical protein